MFCIVRALDRGLIFCLIFYPDYQNRVHLATENVILVIRVSDQYKINGPSHHICLGKPYHIIGALKDGDQSSI